MLLSGPRATSTTYRASPRGRALCSFDGRMITSPKVKVAVQEQFGCDSAQGAPVELDGGDGTAGSHWEETAFFTEVMVGVSGSEGRRVLSPVTLALAEDSGWYTANYAAAGFMRHGHRAGCSMLVCPPLCPQHPCRMTCRRFISQRAGQSDAM